MYFYVFQVSLEFYYRLNLIKTCSKGKVIHLFSYFTTLPFFTTMSFYRNNSKFAFFLCTI